MSGNLKMSDALRSIRASNAKSRLSKTATKPIKALRVRMVRNAPHVTLPCMIRPEISSGLRYFEFTHHRKMVRWKSTVALIGKNAKILNLDRIAREDEVYSLARNNGLKAIPG